MLAPTLPSPQSPNLPWEISWPLTRHHILYDPPTNTFTDLSRSDFALLHTHYTFHRLRVPGKSPTALLVLDDDTDAARRNGYFPRDAARAREPQAERDGEIVLRAPHERVLGEVNFWELGEEVGYARAAGWVEEVWVMGRARMCSAVANGDTEADKQLVAPPSLGLVAKVVGVGYKL